MRKTPEPAARPSVEGRKKPPFALGSLSRSDRYIHDPSRHHSPPRSRRGRILGRSSRRQSTPTSLRAVRFPRALPYGHAAAALEIPRRLRLPPSSTAGAPAGATSPAPSSPPAYPPPSKLATARTLAPKTATSLGALPGLGEVEENERYADLDCLRARQQAIETRVAAHHFGDTLILCDLTSIYFEGRRGPLARRGYNRDRQRNTLQ